MAFASSFSLVNYKKVKTNSKFLGIFFSIIQTYAVFLGLAIVTYISDDFVQSFTLADEEYFALSGIILVTLGGYLAALLLFYFSTFLYAMERRRVGYFILSLCYILVVLVMQIFSKVEFLQF